MNLVSRLFDICHILLTIGYYVVLALVVSLFIGFIVSLLLWYDVLI
jgi:hypothetical protein